MLSIDCDVGAGAFSLKLLACRLVVEMWKILSAFGFYILCNLCNLCRWMVPGSGWVSVGLVWAGREYAWEAPQMGLHHAWLALKDPAFLPTTSALSLPTMLPSCLSGESGIYASIQPQRIIHDCRLCVILWQNKTSNVTLTKKKCRLLTLTKPLLSEMLLVSFNLWKETTWKYFYLLLFS